MVFLVAQSDEVLLAIFLGVIGIIGLFGGVSQPLAQGIVVDIEGVFLIRNMIEHEVSVFRGGRCHGEVHAGTISVVQREHVLQAVVARFGWFCGGSLNACT